MGVSLAGRAPADKRGGGGVSDPGGDARGRSQENVTKNKRNGCRGDTFPTFF